MDFLLSFSPPLLSQWFSENAVERHLFDMLSEIIPNECVCQPIRILILDYVLAMEAGCYYTTKEFLRRCALLGLQFEFYRSPNHCQEREFVLQTSPLLIGTVMSH